MSALPEPMPLPLSPVGFDAGERRLPTSQPLFGQVARERVALLILGIARGYTPEELADGSPPDVLAAFEDHLERTEALDHVDMLLATLLGGQQ